MSFFANFLIPIIIVLSTVVIILIACVVWMHLKLKKFLINVDASNISDSLTQVASDLKEMKKFQDEMEIYLTTVENRLKKSVQSVHTVRFNPFKGDGTGGNQSFATALLAENGDGVIISSLYSREHVSIFSKPVKNQTSEHELSEEENQALEAAKNKLKS